VKNTAQGAGGSSTRDAAGSAQGPEVHLMDEEQYVEYCKKYTEQMGMPFDEGIVRRHYKQMKETFTNS